MNLMNENALLWNRKDSNLFSIWILQCLNLNLLWQTSFNLQHFLSLVQTPNFFPLTLSVHVAYSEKEVIIWEFSYLIDREKYLFIMTLRIKNHLSLLALSESYLSRTTWLFSDNLQDSSKPEASSCFIIDFECVSRARGQLQPAQPGKFSAPYRCFITIR